MINRELLAILWQRYKIYLLLMLALVLGFAVMNSQTGVKNWQAEYHNEKVAKNTFEEQIKYSKADTSPEEKHPGEVMLYHGEGKKETYTKDFKEFRDHQLQFYLTNEIYGSGNGYIYFSQNITVYLVCAIVVGFLTFFLDYKTGFNTLLFSSRFKRGDIFKTKLILIGGGFFIVVIAAKTIALLNLWWQIPMEYFKVDMGQALLGVLASSILTVTVYLTSCLAGIVLAEWVTGLLTISLFWFSLLFLNNALTELVAVVRYELLGRKLEDALNSRTFLMRVEEIYQGYQFNWKLLLLSVVISLIMLVISFSLFNKQDLTHNGEYLAFSFLRKPTVILLVTYITFTVSVTGVSRYMYMTNVTFSPTYFCIKLLISLVVSYVISQLLVYRQLKISSHLLGFNK
ncbi:ABC transporter permease subunit [Vagococcus intermedius]|uniref:ABC transporter permease subunit n=1 Tax=Vagococcus intermedius TaxID=2991418 RepID=A0AAF0CTD7_9ENTE|nr:ABC transporter permease subunit [Vagococcus intermedius]WEG72492.1 ABC transporter permease subunit [Vagococcus intermedius]WEG74579.1 ABC transporter permease subunit [Vagococcus intermedius]